MKASPPPAVSVLLVTRNGRRDLEALLPLLAAQRIDRACEIVAVDSASTDGTPELLAARGARVIAVRPEDFNHGETRNLGVAACRGELVVLLVQDARPVGDAWLATLIEPFGGDARVAGTYARQLPHPDATPLTRAALAGYAATEAEARVQELAGPDAWDAATPAERLRLCTFDNVCSAIRRRVWETLPFPEVPIAEDLHWARAALFAGHRLVYVPGATVLHSHQRSSAYELDRTRACHREIATLFGLRTIPTRRALLRAWTTTIPRHFGLARRTPRTLPHALALAFVWPLGQYLGGRDAARATGAV